MKSYMPYTQLSALPPRATVKLQPELEMVHTLGYIPALPCAHLHSEALQLANEGDPRRVTLSWDAAA